MKLVTMHCENGGKVIINMDELKNAERLKDAVVFNRLFGFDNSGFKEEKLNTNLFKDF